MTRRVRQNTNGSKDCTVGQYGIAACMRAGAAMRATAAVTVIVSGERVCRSVVRLMRGITFTMTLVNDVDEVVFVFVFVFVVRAVAVLVIATVAVRTDASGRDRPRKKQHRQQ
jgi:hypothetical protein